MFIYFFEWRIAGYATEKKKETGVFEYKKTAKQTIWLQVRKYLEI